MQREREGEKVASRPADGASREERDAVAPERGSARGAGAATGGEGSQTADEQVDEAVEESFPASDPPPGPRAPGASR